MKAILRLEMPADCGSCPLLRQDPDRGYNFVCWHRLDEDDVRLAIINEDLTRPDWCPLRPVRERRSKEEIEEALKAAAKIERED